MILQDGKASITIAARTDEFPRLSGWLETVLEEISFPVKAGQQVLICADEIAANVASYAYPSGQGGLTVSAEYDGQTKTLKITFRDEGMPFDPLASTPPDVSLPPEARKIGGLGILVVQKMMDRVEYRRENSCNVLTMMKKAYGGDGKR